MTSRSPALAITWEYWRRGTAWFVAGNIAVALACTSMLYSILLGHAGMGYADLHEELDKGMMAFVFWPPVVLSVAAWRTLRVHYAKPVSTGKLVALSMANGAAATLLMFGTMVLSMRVIFGADWPFVIPALISVTFYLLTQSVAWAAGSSRLLAMFNVALAIGLGAGISSDYLLSLLEPQRGGVTPEWAPWLVMVTVAGFSALLAVRSAACDRRGDARIIAQFQRVWAFASDLCSRWTTLIRRRSDFSRRFRSAGAAQFWVEWRTKGRWIVYGVGVVMCGLFVVLKGKDPWDAEGAVGVVSAMFMLMLPMLGLWLGSDSGRFDLRTFRATRPLSDRQVAGAVLKNVAVVSFLGMLLWMLGAVAVSWRFNTPMWGRLQREWEPGVVNFLNCEGEWIVAALLVWAVCASAASLAMARSWFVVSGGLSLMVILGVMLRFSTWEYMLPLTEFCIWCVAIATFAAAFSQRLISVADVICAVAAWLLLLAVIFALDPGPRPSPETGLWVASFALLPFVPFAAAPLALSWNRHR
jgi:hypothetical protein